MTPSASSDYEKILARLRERILAATASKVGRERAEEIAQDTFMVLLQKYRSVTDEVEMLKLGLTIAAFKVLETFRSKRPVDTPVEELSLPAREEDAAHALMRKQLSTRLRTALLSLEERCRRLFLLRLDGLSFPEIQSAMEIPSLNALYVLDSRCRMKARKLLEEHYKELL
jgi:DNA-directed RNA polymerase specialized sigma24 family protein